MLTSSSAANFSTLPGSSAALPSGPRGRPMSEAPSTSLDRAPTPWPTWLATMAPVALPSMPSRGPAIARASSGRALPRAPTAEPAIGSTRRFQTSVVSTIHSARLQAAVVVTPEGKSVASSSQWSARRTASATASRWAWVGVGSDSWAEILRAMSVTTAQLTGPSWGCMKACIWFISWLRSGMAPPAPPIPPASPLNSCSNGVPLNGFCSSGPSPGLSLMPQPYSPRPSGYLHS